MKFKELNPETNDFKPIELLLTIESKRELEMLLCIFNSSQVELARFLNKSKTEASRISDFTSNEMGSLGNKVSMWEFFKEKLKNQQD